MDSSRCFRRHRSAKLKGFFLSVTNEKSQMDATTVAVDLAKDVIELAVADGAGRVVQRQRVGRKLLCA